jgi:hypothetical protein
VSGKAKWRYNCLVFILLADLDRLFSLHLVHLFLASRSKIEGSYHIYTSIEISPYPKSFEQEAAELKENGMEKIEVIRHDEIAQEQVRLEAKPITEPKVKQPSLL